VLGACTHQFQEAKGPETENQLRTAFTTVLKSHITDYVFTLCSACKASAGLMSFVVISEQPKDFFSLSPPIAEKDTQDARFACGSLLKTVSTFVMPISYPEGYR
jgi:hypothetical protein